MGGGGEALSCEETPQVTIPWKFRLMVGGVVVDAEDGDLLDDLYCCTPPLEVGGGDGDGFDLVSMTPPLDVVGGAASSPPLEVWGW